MAYIQKEREGYCSHSQCPFPVKTTHGYECIDISGGFCEIGDDCLPEREFSWKYILNKQKIRNTRTRIPNLENT